MEIPWVTYKKYMPMAEAIFEFQYPENKDWVLRCNKVGDIIRLLIKWKCIIHKH